MIKNALSSRAVIALLSSRVVIVARDLKELKKDFSQDRALRNDSKWILRYAQNDELCKRSPQPSLFKGVT